ncbi:hypothetical protein [Nonomuraea fuscirosea]|uniref:hypothetical protein n=1 Tax=Nonomuraea fuscirosea TaxID=1291556 RepID=UPI0034088AD1
MVPLPTGHLVDPKLAVHEPVVRLGPTAFPQHGVRLVAFERLDEIIDTAAPFTEGFAVPPEN